MAKMCGGSNGPTRWFWYRRTYFGLYIGWNLKGLTAIRMLPTYV